MSGRKHRGERLPPFVPLLKDTMASPAWRELSHGARSLYVALKARYSSTLHNNGRIFISQRVARRELRSGFTEIARWFRELQHYGFIVQTKGGSLGLNGKGTAPHWRLTECGYMHDPPTRDFLKWNGERFNDAERRRRKKTETRSRNLEHPAPETWSTFAPETWSAFGTKCSRKPEHGWAPRCSRFPEHI
jgi:hypothetical protein